MGCGPCTARSVCGCKSCAEGRRPKRNLKQLEGDSKAQFTTALRGKVKLEVDQADDFLTHHLINEANISPHASSHKIRARQIIQHYMFSEISRAKDTGQVSTSKLTEFALKSWFQRTFLEALEKAEKDFLVEKKGYEEVRAQLCEEYIFEVYQMGEFINAGFSRFSTADRHIEVPLSLVLLNSDSALFPLLTKLQNNYPLVTDVPNMTFPEVPKIQGRPNLLKMFNSKCYADPENLNAQTLMDDLKFIIDEANDLKDDFKSDMLDLLGHQAETDCKVKRKVNPNSPDSFYKAEAVRRVFIKWSQTLIEKIPEVYTLNQFVEFIKSKKKMAEEFIFKGVVSPTTHQQVIQCLSELLQSLKYKNGTKIPRQEFGLFIYDFLRCKTTRNTGQEVVDLLQKLIKTKRTKSGKLFEVVRVKNRFKWATRDILLNFRYGDHIIGEAQLCVDVSHEQDDTARRIKFRHLLYELERGLFGPTFEMIMLFEDASRKDIQVNLQAEGLIKRRNLYTNSLHSITPANRKCPQNHDMIELSTNIFSDQKITGVIESATEFNFCDFCFNRFNYNEPYHYCYYCSIFYCKFCYNTFQRTDKTLIQLMGTNHQRIKSITSPQHLQKVCSDNKSAIVVFYRSGTSASTLFLDQLAYLISAFVSLSKPLPEVYRLNVGKKEFQPLLEECKIDRTPTTVIFNAKGKPQVTIIGATFHDIQSLLKVKDRIAKNQPKGLSLKCTECHSNMIAKVRQSTTKDQKCQICLDTSKIQDLKDVVSMFLNETSDFICKNGHVRCSYCSYLSSDRPSYYRDYTGRTYLSNKFVTEASICPKDHDMQPIPQPKSYRCFNCTREYKGNQDQSISYCSQCKLYICIECEQTDTENYKDKQIKSVLLKQMETVNHFVENRLEESYLCGCGKYFLKVYQTRRLDTNLKITSALSQLMNKGALPWTCTICKQVQLKFKLHLACFYCTYAQSKTGKPAHTEICLPCALKASLIPRQPYTKVLEQQTELKCSKGHYTTLTSKRSGNELFYSCSTCSLKYYPYTERYECRECKLRLCKSCSDQHLNMNVSPTQKKCNKSHQLSFSKTPPKLQFCKTCSVYIQGPHFKCPLQSCDFYLCLKCSSSDNTK